MTLRSVFLALAAASYSLPHLFVSASTTTFSNADIAALRPYTYYASTGYCRPADTLSWSCGENCKANPHFKPVASGGNGNEVQYWYAGYDPKLDSVVVAHQGLDFTMEHALMAVMDLDMSDIDPIFFPGLASKGIAIHSGFMNIHVNAVDDVYTAVKETIEKYDTKTVTFVGHSLGAALGVLDAVFLSLNMPDINLKAVAYGMPRIGNTAFAEYIDEHINITRINNKLDPIPVVPPTEFGYYHPSGEVHILETGEWNVCPGQENDDGTCSAGAVAHMFAGSISDHPGPYDGVIIGCEVPIVPNVETGGPKVEHVFLPPKEEPVVTGTTAEQVVLAKQVDGDHSPIASVHESEL